MPAHHITTGLFIIVPLPSIPYLAIKKKLQELSGILKVENTIWRDRASIRNRYGRDIEIIKMGI